VSLGRNLCLFVLCEIGWQQRMGGQGRYKHSMETRGRMLLDKYKKGSSRAKKDGSVFIVETVVDCVEGGACRVW
jgi:hypothetical protein